MYRADRERMLNATARVDLVVPPEALTRLAALAVVHQMTRAALMRAALEAYVHDEAVADSWEPVSTARTSKNLTIAVTAETRQAAERLAARTGMTLSGVVREALDRMAVECGTAPIFAATGHGQAWPTGLTPGIASRTAIGLTKPRWFMRHLRREEDE